VAQSTFAGRSWPLIGLVFSCATAVEPTVEDDGAGGDGASGGGGAGAQGGISSAGKTTGSGGKASMAFGGTSTSGGAAGNAGTGSATGGSGGKASGGSGGKASGGSGGSAGNATQGGTGGSGGGGGSAGSASGGSSSTGDCAEPDSGWVVQYWTTSAATSMPAGDLRIFNDSGASVNFTTLELRHYFTNEETATLSFVFSTFAHNFPSDPYYQDEGGGNVLSSITALAPPKTNASQFISIKFNSTPGSFGNNEWAQLGFYSSLSMYPMKSNQANDYTYIGHPTSDPGSANKTMGWQRTTLYVSGELVWGCEP
jgi:hypothetical protein